MSNLNCETRIMALQNNGRGMLTEGAHLLQDNGRSLVAYVIAGLFNKFGRDILIRPPPCSPDLVARDYRLLLHMKTRTRGGRFDDGDEMKGEINWPKGIGGNLL